MSRIQVALNGRRGKDAHPFVPTRLEEAIAEARLAVRAGAASVHVHPRDEKGRESLSARVVDRWVAGLRRALGPVPVGIGTGAWIGPAVAVRAALPATWREPPDFASVNVHEADAHALAAALLDRGIGVEAGIGRARDVDRFLAWPRRREVFRILLEVPDLKPAAALAEAAAMIRRLGRAADGPEILLHGEGASAWPVLRHALDRGLSTRIGLEDVLVLPDGTRAPDNAALVRFAADMAASLSPAC